MKWRTHAIALVVFFISFGALKLIWDHPKVILYVVLFIVGLLAYGGIYLVVKAKMDENEPR